MTVYMVDFFTSKFVKVYSSVLDAASQTRLKSKWISDCVNHRRISAGGFFWIYRDDLTWKEIQSDRLYRDFPPTSYSVSKPTQTTELILRLYDEDFTSEEIATLMRIDVDKIKAFLKYAGVQESYINSDTAQIRHNSAVAQVAFGTNEIVAVYDSITDASRKTGIKYTHIKTCAKGESDSAGGYFWKFKNEVSEAELDWGMIFGELLESEETVIKQRLRNPIGKLILKMWGGYYTPEEIISRLVQSPGFVYKVLNSSGISRNDISLRKEYARLVNNLTHFVQPKVPDENSEEHILSARACIERNRKQQ